MHEASIMQNGFEIAFARLPDGSATRISRLRLRVGALASVVPEAPAFAFEASKPDTPASEAYLEVERVPARLVCRKCGHAFAPDTYPSPGRVHTGGVDGNPPLDRLGNHDGHRGVLGASMLSFCRRISEDTADHTDY